MTEPTIYSVYKRYLSKGEVTGDRDMYGDIENVVPLADYRAHIDRLEGDIRCMVEKAADNHLEGYRELGRQLAEKDAQIDSLRFKLATTDGGE